MVADIAQRINFRNGDGESVRRGLEPADVVNATHGQAVKMAGNAGEVVVQGRGDVHNFGEAVGQEPREVGPAPDAFAFSAEFEIAPDWNTNGSAFGFVKRVLVVTCLDTAGDPDAVFGREMIEAGQAQVGQLRIPNENMIGWDARGEQAFERGGDNGRTGAAVGTRCGKDFDGDDVLCGNKAPPGLWHGGGAGEVGEAAGHHLADVIWPGTKGISSLGIFDDDDAGGAFARA